MLEHVSLSFNKKQHLKVCKCYKNIDVRVILISYGMHGFVLRVFYTSKNRFNRKFQEHVNHNTGY
jgi:hypothetical protein